MTANGWFQIILFLGLILLVTKPLGIFLYRVYEGKSTFLDPVLRPIEKLIYRVSGIDETKEMDWKGYGVAMLLFSGVSLLILYLIERMQQWLPWNPQGLANVAPDLAWNTAVSFTTNTNWQSYTPETTMSLLHPDGRACVSQFCVSGRWHRLGDRRDSRDRAQGIENDRQFLGGHDPRLALGFSAAMHRGRPCAGLAGCGAEPEAIHTGAARGTASDRKTSG